MSFSVMIQIAFARHFCIGGPCSFSPIDLGYEVNLNLSTLCYESVDHSNYGSFEMKNVHPHDLKNLTAATEVKKGFLRVTQVVI